MSELTLALPPFCRDRVIREAVLELERLHGERLPDKVPWPVLAGAVLAYARHRFSNYDEIVTVHNRSELQLEIRHRIFSAWPWMSNPPSPEEFGLLIGCAENEDQRYFNRLSRQLADLHTEKDRILLALARAGADRVLKQKLQAELRELTELIEQLAAQFKDQSQLGPKYEGVHCLRYRHRQQGEYNLGELPEYRIKSAGFKCRRCSSTVLMTKQPTDFGCGIRLIRVSCRCQSIAVTGRVDNALGQVRLALKASTWLLDEERGGSYANSGEKPLKPNGTRDD